MKKKMIKLFMLFLTIGLFSSSRNSSSCHNKCTEENKLAETAAENISGGGDIERPLTPGNFLFFY